MERSANRVTRRLGAALAALGLAAGLVSAGGGAAQADPAPISAMVLRNVDTTIYRQPSGTTTLNVAQGTSQWQGTDYPVLDFTSQIGSDSSTFESVSVSGALTPGTYSTSRIPGQAQAILDPGSIEPCGDDEPGTMTVQQADYDSDGNPIDFAASFDVASCESAPPVHGELRWNSATPLALAQAPALTSVASPVTVNASAEATAQFTAVGNAPAAMGAATLSQTPMSDGYQDWSIVDDGCSGKTLTPGASCTVTARIAPIRPDGSPYGTVYATIEVPDGQSIDASAQVAAKVYPLEGQPIALQARGTFRQVVLTWGQPQAVPTGWSVFHQRYEVYEYLKDGSLHPLDATQAHIAVITGLADQYAARYVVRDEQSGADAPLSVPATATTATKQLIYISASGGMQTQRLAPDPETSTSANITDLHNLNGAGSTGLTVARNQSVLGYSTYGHSQAQPTAYVCTANVDASPGAAFCSGTDTSTQWDTAPSLSPNGTRVVFTHASAPGGPTTLEIASTSTGAKATVVPGSSGLSDATFDAAGTGLVAVRADGDSTELVTLGLTGGTPAVIPASAGLSDPDVAADGRIVAVQTTPDTDSPGAPPTTSLVLLPPRATSTDAIAGAQSGTNVRPRFSADGTSVYYTHDDAPQAMTAGYGDVQVTGDGDQVDLASGTVTDLAGSGDSGTPDVLTADGTHRADTAAPSVRMVAPSASVDLGTTAIGSWISTDSPATNQVASGVRDYDVRYRTASTGHSFGAYSYPSSWQATINPSASIKVSAGHEYCFSARARDYAGNVSAWTADRCTMTPVDDRSLHTTASRRTSSSYYLRTDSYARKKATRFTLGGVTGDRIGILAATCSSCGSIQVSIGSHTLGRISTHAASTHYRQTLWLPTTSTRTGTLTITTRTAAPVHLDGVVVQH